MWQALDSDRGKWWFFGAYVVLAIALIAVVSLLWTFSDQDGRSLEAGTKVIAALVPALVLPLARKKAIKSAQGNLGAVSIPDDVFPETSSALHDMELAAGISAELQVFASNSINGFVTEKKGTTQVAVSIALTRLPLDEQRAAFAILLGRRRVAVDSLLVGAARNGMPITSEGEPIDRELIKHKPGLLAQISVGFVRVASVGDREALMLTKEPGPLLTLLTRLSAAERHLHNVEIAAAYSCLAWPFETPAGAAPAIGDTELQRLQSLKQVIPAAETVVNDPKELPEAPVRRPSQQQQPAPAVRAPSPQEVARAAAHGPRLAIACPKCRASNAPANQRCVSCGARFG